MRDKSKYLHDFMLTFCPMRASSSTYKLVAIAKALQSLFTQIPGEREIKHNNSAMKALPVLATAHLPAAFITMSKYTKLHSFAC